MARRRYWDENTSGAENTVSGRKGTVNMELCERVSCEKARMEVKL